jgi:hypothetical protein
MEVLFGTPPPPPPPEVANDLDATTKPVAADGRTLSVRERMEEHRKDSMCRSCHRVIDPLGLALENFDAVGTWRAYDQGKLVDASGQLGDGTKLDGAAGLREALLKRPEVLVNTAAEKLLTYALGRGLEPQDMPAVRAIVRGAKDDGYRFDALIAGVVSSKPFLMRSAEEKQ